MFRINVSACALFLACVLPVAAQPQAASANANLSPAAVTYYGCVNNSTGAIRLVSKTTTCKATEHKINWNEVGPRGPQGAPGISLGYSLLAGPTSRRSILLVFRARTSFPRRCCRLLRAATPSLSATTPWRAAGPPASTAEATPPAVTYRPVSAMCFSSERATLSSFSAIAGELRGMLPSTLESLPL